jgi:2'-5' RNA ligase
MATMRLFTGVALPEAYAQGLGRLAGRWRARLGSRTSWTRPENWHVTLKFLGDVDEGALDEVRAALGRVAFGAFTLRAGGAGFFPPRGEPRVVWVGVDEGGRELGGLAEGVERALAPLGFAPEARAYRPHLTVARVRRAASDPWSELARELGQEKWPAFEVRAFTLWNSVLGASGPTHHRLADFGATSM